MAKHDDQCRSSQFESPVPGTKTPFLTLRSDFDLWYRIHVLLYDLTNVAKDPLSAQRLSLTTNELYISEPYFSPSEADMIRTSTIDQASVSATESASSETLDETGQGDGTDHAVTAEELDAHDNLYDSSETVTIEQAVQTKLANFFGKRKASGDARPCGPHDLVPVYTSVFGIDRNDLKDEPFLSRLRRTGLGVMQPGKAQGEYVKASKDGKPKKQGNKRQA